MHIIKNDMSAFFDCDGTLVLWEDPNDGTEPFQLKGESGLVMDVWPHHAHISKMKEHHIRGHEVIVWSAGGWLWALATVEALGLEKYVDYVMGKPTWAWDDLTPNEFIRRAFIKPGAKDEEKRQA